MGLPSANRIAGKLLAVLGTLAALTPAPAQQTRILSFDPNGTLTWTNSTTNVYCSFEYTMQLPGGWESSPLPYWNILVTSHVMSVTVPLAQIQASFSARTLASRPRPMLPSV